MILKAIAEQLGVDETYLWRLSRRATHCYKTYYIKKRTGGRRKIDHPTPELKALQRWLTINLFSALPVHHAVYSYKKGFGISDCARIHAKNNYLLRIDFTDFFPSLRRDDVAKLLRKNSQQLPNILTKSDIEVICDIVCRNGALTIGAPSSPILSNAILYEFDSGICEKAKSYGVVYSRYADDLYFSTNKPNVLEKILELLIDDLRRRPYPKLSINDAKTTFTSKKRRRVVTGVTLTSDNQLSVGRDRKRLVKGMIYHYSQKKLPTKDISYLRGLLAHINSIEPKFIKAMRKKYGSTILDSISSEPIMRRKVVRRRRKR